MVIFVETDLSVVNFEVIVVVVVVVVCRHIINHPGLSTQYLLLSQFSRTNPTLDSADFRGHRTKGKL